MRSLNAKYLPIVKQTKPTGKQEGYNVTVNGHRRKKEVDTTVFKSHDNST